jgi:predicted amidohydrolase
MNDSQHVVVSAGQMGASQDVADNVRAVLAMQKAAAADGVELLVLPECVLSGYMYDSRADALSRAVRLDGPELGRVAAACRELRLHCVLGYLETTAEGALYNSAVLIDDAGAVVGNYRKTHLPFLGVDRFTDAGEQAPPVYVTRLGAIGIAICYDLRFPETARVLALAGADVIAQPSTWPYEAAVLAEHFVTVRACENRVFMVVANRPDAEAGSQFMGRSQIVAPSGARLAEADTSASLLVTARVDLAQAREKRIVNVPGEYEVSLFADRRPDLYRSLAH